MRRESLLAIWIGGFVLAVLLYVIGPDRFFDSVINTVDSIQVGFRQLIAALGAQAYGAIRAAAIALYLVFAVLSILAAHRQGRGIGALVVVTIVFLVLVWRPHDEFSAPIGRWCVALLLVFIGAAVMTQRLLIPNGLRRGGPPPNYPPGRGP
ncbi:MAG TPA: hypothetical protein VE690_18630 [Rhodopila sp.]|nr:hypothetical protein [Rhodopila sp.]